jgi:hypothetical protein
VLDVEPVSRALGHPVRHWRDALREYGRQVDEAGAL